MKIVNLLDGELPLQDDREGWRHRAARIGEAIGGAAIGGSIYSLEDGQGTFPYHYHHGIEEWLVVIDGAPTVRTSAGERVLSPGEVVVFRAGPDGAHLVRGPGRVLILSANREPSITVFPESDKLGTRPGGGADGDRLNFRRGDAVDYWDGEA